MSKLPVESRPFSNLPTQCRPIPLIAEIARPVEKMLASLSGKQMESAKAAVLKVFESGRQQGNDQWVADYSNAIKSAIKDER